MIKFTKLFITFLFAIFVFRAQAQQTTATTSNPYSQFGLGELLPQTLPQNIGMGGLGAAINNTSGYFNINPVNPASYGAIGLTAIDLGIYGNITSLSQYSGSGQRITQSNGNFKLDHINFAFPVTKHSALSFGLAPYSQVGYNYKTTQKNFGTGSSIDTNNVNYIYSGNGGLNKGYIGYGIGIGKHLLLGANASYIFGKIQQYSSTEIPSLYGTLNSTEENTYSIGGGSYDFGAQYTIDLTTTKHIILGYSTTLGTSLNSQYTYVVSQYDYTSGVQNLPLDTIDYSQSPKTKFKIPQTNHYGITYVSDGKYLVGAEYTSSNWSTFSIGGVNQGLQDTKTYNLGGQITPNINALTNYFATVDYRLGFIYNQTYVNVNNATNNTNTSINNYAITFGLGLPLAPTYSSFYKINFAAEIGRQGTLNNGLVRETYVNLHLSFTLNDTWFKKYKLE